MSKSTERVTGRTHIYSFQPRSTHPYFLFGSSCMNHWNVRNVLCKQTLRKHITGWECLYFEWRCPMLLSFHPGSHQISAVHAERAACGSTGWFFKGLQDWQVYSRLNVKGLSLSAAPEPPAGSVFTQEEVKNWITGFVFLSHPTHHDRYVMAHTLRLWDFNLSQSLNCVHTWWIVAQISSDVPAIFAVRKKMLISFCF